MAQLLPYLPEDDFCVELESKTASKIIGFPNKLSASTQISKILTLMNKNAMQISPIITRSLLK